MINRLIVTAAPRQFPGARLAQPQHAENALGASEVTPAAMRLQIAAGQATRAPGEPSSSQFGNGIRLHSIASALLLAFTMTACVSNHSSHPTASTPNTLSTREKAVGWELLFDGKDLHGWHNFKSDSIKPGWQVKDGTLACVDPKNAGDIVTTQQFDWFELELDYNISEAGNSGIMYHVTDQGDRVWQTGPEFQLEDNVAAHDQIRCGWLYALYQPPDDPKTGKPLDATKPVGEWNHVRLVLSPQKCEHFINGVKYFEYVLGSEDFKSRVAKSKFGKMPLFAKSNTGYIALQGDHGQVAFRNIKIRQLKAGD